MSYGSWPELNVRVYKVSGRNKRDINRPSRHEGTAPHSKGHADEILNYQNNLTSTVITTVLHVKLNITLALKIEFGQTEVSTFNDVWKQT